MMRDYLERLGFKFPSRAGGLEDGRLLVPARRNADRTLVDVALAGGRVKREMNELSPPIPCREAKARRATQSSGEVVIGSGGVQVGSGGF